VEYRHEDGLSIPDVPVLTQDGRQVHFYSDLVKDKIVAMNFIFTTCTTICPPLGANFGKLQQLLGDKAGRDIYLISVSVDPVTDTPDRMKAWGEVFGAGPGWSLVTGQKGEVTKLLKALQVFTPDINDHSPVVLVGGGADGTWTRAYGLAPPKELAAMLEKLETTDEGAGGGAR
jgi:protein SCO1/2